MSTKSFYVAGINYKKADEETRGLFALNNDNYKQLLTDAPSFNINEIFVLSTCNRTEIYGFANDADDLINLLCAHTAGNIDDFKKVAHIKINNEAIEHLFNVGAGLDSQILGDYEIVSQLKIAVKFAKQHQRVGAYTERLVNTVLQASKAIKNNTQLSCGTVSVAFASIQFIRASVKDISSKKILLLGIGKIGRNACKNLIDYLNTRNITLINRSYDKALALANELGLKATGIENLQAAINNADIILLATNAQAPVILQSHFKDTQEKVIIDLSVPCNVEESVKSLPFIKVINVDELSCLKDETLNKRQAEVPKAREIIAAVIKEFYDWHAMRNHVPMLTSLKGRLKEIHSSVNMNIDTPEMVDTRIQKVLNETAGKIKTENLKGCFYISAINDFICTS